MSRPLTSALIALVVTACTGIDPVIVKPKSSPQPAADGGGDVAALPPLCTPCLQAPDLPGPGCADEVKACDDDPKCKAQQACYAEQCGWARAPSDVFACGSQCFAGLGVATADPASLLSYRIYLCSTGACKPICFPDQ
ncbi:MAG TPA: hypothetical protein VF395_19695 [Polyangiaceae bacterium]